jgi:hypothetical protein
MFALFSFWECGCPDAASDFVDSWKERASPLSRAYAWRLLEDVRRFCRSGELSACSLDGARKRVSEVLNEVLTSAYGEPMRDCSGVSNSVACEIDPLRISLPASAGLVDPLPFLYPSQQAVHNDMSSLLIPQEEWEEFPEACQSVSKESEEIFVRRLLESNMCVSVEEELLPCAKSGRKLVGGLFGAPESNDKRRLIFERGPQNYCERQVKRFRLPYPAQLTCIVLSRHQVLLGSAADLSNY